MCGACVVSFALSREVDNGQRARSAHFRSSLLRRRANDFVVEELPPPNRNRNRNRERSLYHRHPTDSYTWRYSFERSVPIERA